MGYSKIEYALNDRVAWLWLNRPAKRNALDIQMLEEIIDVATRLKSTEQADAMVIRAKGEVFCAGADLILMQDLEKKNAHELEMEAGLFFDMYYGLYSLDIPLITYVHGTVRGGGNGIHAVSDIVLAEHKTIFAFPEVRLGLIPATVAPFVIQKVGHMQARRLLATAFPCDADEALRLGLADRVVGHAQSSGVIDGLLAGILENGPSAVRVTKNMVTGMGGFEMNEDIRRSAIELQVQSRRSSEAAEGITAFFNKRHPAWNRRNKA